MGKYRAQMSVPNHLFGTIREYDDTDPVLLHRVASGMLVRVDGPAKAQPVTKPEPPVEVEVEAVEDEPVKRTRKRPVKKVEAVSEEASEPEPEQESEPEVKPDLGTSSVQTSWQVAD